MRLIPDDLTPEDWISSPIKFFVNEHRGGASLKPSDFKESGFPVIPKKAIQPGNKLVIDKPTFCSEEFADNNTRSIVDNSFSVTTLRDLVPTGPTIGTVVNFYADKKYMLAQGVYGLRLNEKIDRDYFANLSNAQFYRKIMRRIMVGSTQVHIRTPEYLDIIIQVPSLPEQKKISRILATWDIAIETVEKLIENSEVQKKALAQQLLTGKRRLRGFDGKWEFASFRELFKIANDKTKQVKKSDYEEIGDFPVVDQGKKMIAAYANSSTPYSDIPVIVFGDHTRITKWVNFYFVPGADGTQLLKTTRKLDLRFAYFLLSNATLPNLGYSRHMRELKEKEFKYPCSLYEQKAIARILEVAEQDAQRCEGLLKMLKTEKKALMQQLLTGRRRVRVEDHQRMKVHGI